jgi:hypothetical protein
MLHSILHTYFMFLNIFIFVQYNFVLFRTQNFGLEA